MGENKQRKKCGRPLGFKLSEESKRAISRAKTGQRHSQETKDKISKSLLAYFRKINPLSKEIINTYCRADDDELCEWANKASDELDESSDIMTTRALYNSTRTETQSNIDIDSCSHKLTPERVLILKEEIKENNIDDINIEDLL